LGIDGGVLRDQSVVRERARVEEFFGRSLEKRRGEASSWIT